MVWLLDKQRENKNRQNKVFKTFNNLRRNRLIKVDQINPWFFRKNRISPFSFKSETEISIMSMTMDDMHFIQYFQYPVSVLL